MSLETAKWTEVLERMGHVAISSAVNAIVRKNAAMLYLKHSTDTHYYGDQSMLFSPVHGEVCISIGKPIQKLKACIKISFLFTFARPE